MPSSIHTIRAASIGGAPFVEVPVAGWGEIRLQRLQPHQREKFADLLAGEPGDPLDLICTTAVDDGGAPLFAKDEDRALLEARADVVEKLGAAAVKLNTSAAVGVKDSASVTE